MAKEIELAKQHGIQYRLTPEGTTEMWCHDRNVQAFAEVVRAAERERCAEVAYAFLDDPFLSGHGYATGCRDAILAGSET